jgi:hypothetical protein
MVANLTRLTHKIAIQLHLVAESFTTGCGRSGNFWLHLRSWTICTMTQSEGKTPLIIKYALCRDRELLEDS